MKFKMPADADKLTLEGLTPLRQAILDESAPLLAIEGDLTDEQFKDMTDLAAVLAEVDGHIEVATVAATERQSAIDAARAQLAGGSEDENVDEEAADEEAAEPEVETEVPAEDIAVEVPELVTAGGGVAKPVARKAAGNAKPVVVAPSKRVAVITAAAGVPDFEMGKPLEGMEQLRDAFISRRRGMPTTKGRKQAMSRFEVANIQKPKDDALHIKRGDPEGNYDKLMLAGKQSRLPGGSLVAAGTWCAPSETVYELCVTAEVAGTLDMPEVTVEHGGVNHANSPQVPDIIASLGWDMTEAEVEALDADTDPADQKQLIDVECPDFTDTRLDAIGYGIRAGFLTEAAWPGLVQHYLDLALIAHAHKRNRKIIGKIVTALGAVVNGREKGAISTDLLEDLEMQAMRIRYRNLLDPEALIEGMAPAWLIGPIRADISRRMGIDDPFKITLADINSYLLVRGIRLQWVLDWQDATMNTAGVEWPTTVQVGLWVPGTFVVGTSDVVRLDAVYDTASLQLNTFTAMYFEEGVLVFSPCGNGNLVELAVNNTTGAFVNGRVGAADITHA